MKTANLFLAPETPPTQHFFAVLPVIPLDLDSFSSPAVTSTSLHLKLKPKHKAKHKAKHKPKAQETARRRLQRWRLKKDTFAIFQETPPWKDLFARRQQHNAIPHSG